MSALPKGPICVEYGSEEAHSAMVLTAHSPAIPKLLQVGGDGGVQLRGLDLLLAQYLGKPLNQRNPPISPATFSTSDAQPLIEAAAFTVSHADPKVPRFGAGFANGVC